MTTVVLGAQPALDDWLAQRRVLGQDRFDEMWDGVLHAAPTGTWEHGRVGFTVLQALSARAEGAGLLVSGPVNVGTGPQDYRVPDGALVWAPVQGAWVPTAALVLEVLSPDDETWTKLPYYFARGVEEVLVAHPERQWLQCWVRGPAAFESAERSGLLDAATNKLQAEVRWP